MTGANQGSQYIIDDGTLADHGFLQFGAQRLGEMAGALPLLGLVADGGHGFEHRIESEIDNRFAVVRRLGRLLAHKAFLRICRWAT